MKPKIAEIVTSDDWKLLNEIRYVLDSLPAKLSMPAYLFGYRLPREMGKSDLIPNCHVITRSLSKFFPVTPHDGMMIESRPFQKEHRMQHSWLTRKGGNDQIIFDVWPLGVVSGPFIAIQDYAYHYGNEQSYLIHGDHSFKVQVAVTRLAIRKVLQKKSTNLPAAA